MRGFKNIYYSLKDVNTHVSAFVIYFQADKQCFKVESVHFEALLYTFTYISLVMYLFTSSF